MARRGTRGSSAIDYLSAKEDFRGEKMCRADAAMIDQDKLGGYAVMYRGLR